MTESQFYKATHDGVCGFEVITYKTEERTSNIGAITGVYEKVITCFIEGEIAARLTIYVSTFETRLEARKKKGGLEYIFDWQLKGYIRNFSKDLVELLQFRNKKTDEIDKYMTKKSMVLADRHHLLGFILGRCVIGYSSDEDQRKSNFHTFVNFIIKSFGWENYFRLEVIKHDEPEEGNG